MAVPVLSFFTGGGLFDICWTNEHHPPFVAGYESGMSSWLTSRGTKAVNATIANTSSVCDLTARTILKQAFHGERPQLFGVVGGPPCPDFSNGGLHAGGNGTNGKLTTVFVDMICSLKPTFFVIENVPGLFRFHKHRAFLMRKIAQLQQHGYAIDYKILNALELGVPQDRERLFVVGFKKSITQKALGKRLTDSDTNWFPWPANDLYTGAKSLAWPETSKFGNRPAKPTGIPIELTVYPALAGNGNPEKLPNGRDVFEPYSGRFWETEEGDVANKSFKRLHRYRFSPTAWYGNQEVHLHPWKPRRLSVREALRIQSVPDEYVLPADVSLSAKFKLICNGVPCLMAMHVASAVRTFLKRTQP
jgi:DNA (cytosine-5)-methyltransferase 1